ncbi:LamG domain-containing protein [Candidatus Micrarchaeota archaeon]|nr:LamG domain-containing protein [Candidatus Micrarchaeota archaeon]
MKRGQGAFEYVLLMAGVLLIVVLSVAVFRGLSGKSLVQIRENVETVGRFVCYPLYLKEPSIGEIVWKMNENGGNILHDETIPRINGLLGDGEASRMPTWRNTAECKYPPCLRFDGLDDIVVSESSPNVSGANGFTYEFWVLFEDMGSGHTAYIANKVSTFNIFIRQTDIAITPQGSVPAGVEFHFFPQGEALTVSDPETVYTLTPHHILVTYDAGTKTARLYIDGRLIGEDTASGTGAIVDTGTRLYVGGFPGLDLSVQGMIDEVRLLTRGVNEEEVQDLFQCTVT